MLRVGLTGGIGAGKSAVAARLAALGAVVIDSDRLAREVVAPGTGGLAEVVEVFGSGVLVGGELDRAALGRRVFGDQDARRRLEAIIHPRVRARTAELTAATGDAIVVNDVPLLVEVGLAPTYHLVLVVEADQAVRLVRLVHRGLNRAEAEARMAAQTGDAQRRAAADVVIDNSDSLGALSERVDAVWGRLVAYADNLRLGRVADRPTVLTVVEPDPGWPAAYARLAARLRLAAGDAVLTLDHVGSTSVAGLSAKDVLDVQLGVRDLDAADALAPALAAIGLPPRPGVWYDNPKPPDTEVWPKRLHGSADPELPVNLHVRPVGSPGWRWAPLFRDWLRANPAELAGYAAEKTRLVALGLDAAGYAEAKEPWFDAAHDRVEAWAAATGWLPPGSDRPPVATRPEG